jgi:GWxTD domain-containing protein
MAKWSIGQTIRSYGYRQVARVHIVRFIKQISIQMIGLLVCWMTTAVAQTNDGVVQFEAGRYGAAEAVFRQMIEQSPGDANAYYWLGRSLYEQNREKDAIEQFKKSYKLDKKNPAPHIGIGQAYLRMPKHRYEARTAFQRAERLAPADANIQDFIGLTFANNLGKRREYGLDGRHYFRKAIEMDPQHPNAYYHLGLTYDQSPGPNYKEAIPHYFNQLIATPDHVDALQRLVQCIIKTDQHAEGVDMVNQIGMLPGAEMNAKFEIYRAQLYAVVLQEKERNFAEAYEVYEDMLSRLGMEEKKWFTDLTLVAPAHIVAQYERVSERDQQEIWRRFWAERDPDPTTVVNERLVEHYRRVLFARMHFAQAKKPWDRRGDIYIRYGEPDDRQPVRGPSNDEASYFPTGNGRVDSIREVNRRLRYQYGGRGFTESWVYVPYGIEIILADRFSNGIYDYPPPAVNIRADRYHPEAVMAELMNKHSEGYRYDYGGEPMEFLFDVVTYRGLDNQTEVEIDYSIPARQLGYAHDEIGGDLTSFSSHVVLRDDDLYRVADTALQIGPIERPKMKIPKNRAQSNVRIASLHMTASPGRYRTAVAIRDSVSRRIGIYEASLVVWNYDNEAMNLSDIKLATDITRDAAPGPFVRNGFKITPNPSLQFKRTSPIHLYYELYNLTKGEDGRTAYRTDIEITMKQKEMNIVFRFFAALGRLIKADEEEESVLLSFEGAGAATDQPQATSIDPTDSSSGDYTIRLTITDLHSGQSVVKAKDFVLLNDRKPPVEDPTLP